MIANFGSWYREVQIEPNHDRLQKRWAAVEKAAKGCNKEAALELARLFNGFEVSNAPWPTSFMKRFSDEDSAFDSNPASAEIVVLAGATIAQILESKEDAADLVAMATQVAAFGLSPEKRRIADIRTTLDFHLISRGTLIRAGPVRRPTSKGRSKKIEEVFSALQTGHQQAAEPIKAILAELSAQIGEVEEKLVASERIREESSGVLWWLMGAYSETLNVPFSTVPPMALPVLCAFELAQLTRMTPGLPNARAFLLQAFGARAPQDQTIIEWICAVERPVRTRLLEKSAVSGTSPLLPVLDAMRRSLELTDDDLWTTDVRRRGPSYTYSAIDLAEQVYRELLLIRHLSSHA